MARKNVVWGLLVLLLLAAGYGFSAFMPRDPRPEDVAPPMATAAAVYERVVGTGILHCGYHAQPPYFTPDENHLKPTGLVPDLLAEIGSYLNIGIALTPEQPGRQETAINDSLVDAYCLSTPESAVALRTLDFGKPLFYVPLYFYSAVKSGPYTAAINSPKTRIALAYGTMGTRLIARRYGLAKRLMTTPEDGPQGAYLAVAEGRADVVLADQAGIAVFNAAHAHMPLQKNAKDVVYMQPVYIATAKGDQSMRAMLDDAILNLSIQGTLGAYVKKYDSCGTLILLPAPPVAGAVVSPSQR